jgi:hypothetical protein
MAEGTPAMLVGRCSSELSAHRLQGKLKKSQPPTGAYPDFLPRCIGHDHVCGFIKESRRKFTNATDFYRKSGVTKWRDLLFNLVFAANAFRRKRSFSFAAQSLTFRSRYERLSRLS